VIAGKQVDRHRDLLHRFEETSQRGRAQPVMLKDVASDNDELGLCLAGDRADTPQRLHALAAHNSAGVSGNVTCGEAELPVGRVEKADGGSHGSQSKGDGGCQATLANRCLAPQLGFLFACDRGAALSEDLRIKAPFAGLSLCDTKGQSTLFVLRAELIEDARTCPFTVFTNTVK
jgi:hypothetical protein